MIDKKTGLLRVCDNCKSDKTYTNKKTGIEYWVRLDGIFHCRKCYWRKYYHRHHYLKFHEQELEKARRWRMKHKDAIWEKTKIYREQNKEKVKSWRRDHYRRNIDKMRLKQKNFYSKNRDRLIQYAKDYYTKIKYDCFSHYTKGTMVCECCGESEFDFLTIDHIDGGGKEHRHVSICAWLLKHSYPEGFRVLCFNCNCVRGKLGYCPHEKKQIRSMISINSV